MMEIMTVLMDKKEGQNIIVGQSHFIKTVEDLYEALAQSAPGAKFGIAFCEASGDRLIRTEGNDTALEECAAKNAKAISAGHVFVIILEDIYPINCLNSIKQIPEVCTVFAATANDLSVVVAQEGGRRGVVGVIDGETPLGTEGEEEKKKRMELLRTIGYKR